MILGIAIDAAQGVAELHECSPPIAHTNLSSNNLLLFEDSSDAGGITAKVSEPWQTIKIKNSHDSEIAMEPSQLYLAPEILQGEDHNQVADIFSLGVLLNELDTGEQPYSQLNPATPLTRSNITNDHVRPRIRTTLDASVSKIIRRCWKYDLCAQIERSEEILV